MAPSRPTDQQLRDIKFRKPQKAWKKLRAKFKRFEDEGYMKYKGVLGFGGFGLVLEWYLLKQDGSLDRTIAMKTCLDREHQGIIFALRREIYWHKKFTGSEHLMQLVDMDPRVMKEAGINQERSADLPCVMMEKMGRGSLSIILHRIAMAAKTNPKLPVHMRVMEYIPSRTLWSIFLCLTRSVIGMAYPANDPLTRKGYSIRESAQGIPPGYQYANIIHSDIDPRNIFVANPRDHDRDAEHRWAPIIKIADYGCMVEWREEWSNHQKNGSIWGKTQYKAPEQFKPRAFDYLAITPQTNIYQVGQTMHDLVTLRSIKERELKQRLVKGADFQTFGWRVLGDAEYKIDNDWENVDLVLRELIAGCMADQPYDRPGPRALEHMITTRIEQIDRQAATAPKTAGFNPAASAFVPGQASSSKLNPASQAFVPGAKQPGPPQGAGNYKRRVPLGEVEPEWILQKFYQDYFADDWNAPDLYEGYWSKRTLTPEPGDE